MRILTLVPEAFGGHGGISQYCRDVIEALAAESRGFDLTVLPRLAENTAPAVPNGVDYRMRAIGGIGAYGRETARVLFERETYDLILCAHINLLPFAVVFKPRFRAPILLLIYGIDAWRPARRALLSQVAAVASISRYTARRFRSWSGFREDRIHLLPNAIRLKEYGMRERPRYLVERHGLEGCCILLTLGRLNAAERYKGFDEIIELMPELIVKEPSLRYLIVGDGSDRERLERKCAEYGVIDRVLFVGRIREEEKADYYRLADAFTMAGYGEGFGFVFLEAMACGIPVVASSLDGSRDAVLDGRLGYLVDPRDRTALRDALLKALKQQHGIPTGLEYFDYPQFRRRLFDTVGTVVHPACRRH